MIDYSRGARYGGLAKQMPKYALIFMIFTMASIGLPGTSGFVGEFLILVGAYQKSTLLALILATGMVLGAAYMLYLYRRIGFGELEKDELKAMMDLNKREMGVFAPLVVLTLWMGIYPASFLEPIAVSVTALVENYQLALEAGMAPRNLASWQ